MQKTRFTYIATCSAVLILAALGCVHAAPSATAGIVPAADLSRYNSTFTVPIVQASTPLPPAVIDSASPTVRLADVQQIATANGLTWEKVYAVSPADARSRVTTLADAMQMADQAGQVSLFVTNIPAAKAIRTVADADDATVDLSDSLRMGSIDVHLTNDSVAQAIAAIAHRTHTHWSAEYVLGPPMRASVITAQNASARVPMTQQEYEETQLFNGPITYNVAPPPAQPVAPVAAVAAAAVDGADKQAAKDAAAAAAASPAPYPNPYMPYSGYFNYVPQPYSLSPGITVQPGNPWAGGSIVFGGTNTTSF